MVSNDSSTVHVLYTLFLLLLHQLHLRASGIRSGRLGTPVIRNFFMQLWRWKSPTMCRLQAGDPGSGGAITSEFEDLKTRMAKDRRSMASSRNQVKGWILPSSTFSFCWSSQGLDEAHSYLGEQTSSLVLSPLIQTLVSTGNTLTGTTRNNM